MKIFINKGLRNPLNRGTNSDANFIVSEINRGTKLSYVNLSAETISINEPRLRRVLASYGVDVDSLHPFTRVIMKFTDVTSMEAMQLGTDVAGVVGPTVHRANQALEDITAVVASVTNITNGAPSPGQTRTLDLTVAVRRTSGAASHIQEVGHNYNYDAFDYRRVVLTITLLDQEEYLQAGVDVDAPLRALESDLHYYASVLNSF